MHTIKDSMQFKLALSNFVQSFLDESPAPGYNNTAVGMETPCWIGVVIKQFQKYPLYELKANFKPKN